MPIGEIHAGFRVQPKLGRFKPFVEVAGVAQVWWGLGNASNSHLTEAGGGHDNANMGLYGGRVSLGYEF